MENQTDTRVSTITFRDDGLIFVACWKGVEFTEEDAHETLEKIDVLTGDKRVGHCVDLRAIKSMDRAARTVFANGPNTLAAALVVSNPLSRIIGNFFLGLSKSSFPLRLFNEPDPGIAWLKSL